MSLLIRAATPADIADLVRMECRDGMGNRSTSGSIRRSCGAASPVCSSSHGAGFYLVAERDGVAAGSLLVTFEWSDWRCGDFWWIQSVYVHPAARRGGVFRALYAAVEQRAAAAGAVGLRLYVETENQHAQADLRGTRHATLPLLDVRSDAGATIVAR